ncbi:SLOG family protein [Bacillus kwashiorkori]|uniref:SLOG family protein n=1 Tax=Bacillus kwashiorkori TaxID=1522318 RepID=UPI0008F97578|nr:DUF1273 domain-containing protein [Bacillus kwashiorkori]
MFLRRIVITGYKAYELGIFNENHPGIHYIKKALAKELVTLLDDGLEWVLLSGQLGVETWAAQVIMDLKDMYPQLKYAVIPPFLDQEATWNENNQHIYQEIIEFADYYRALTEKPYEGPWQFMEKNKFFIRNSDGLLIIYDEEMEGSPKYIKKLAEQYAKNNDYRIISITQYDLQAIVETEQMDQMDQW